MDFYVDVTPAPSPSVFYSSQAGDDRRPGLDNSHIGATQFVTTNFSGLDFVAPGIDTTEKPVKNPKEGLDTTPIIPRAANASTSRASAGEDSLRLIKEMEIKRIAQNRIRLLAIKYADNDVSAEIIARLEILNSRLIERSPRVTSEQVNFLEASISSLNSVELSRQDRAKRLGLSV
ncbi:hypothetical protein [Pseudomonas sp. W5-36]|uniref:hypothetical protein n=1 Tax=Pseudomonas sp. W5-36 TaxID=3097455 RepID=UPI00397C8862